MNRRNNQTNYVGMGFCDVLLIVFIVLKLTHVIEWSWWWVTAPFWIPLCIVIIVIVVLWKTKKI